MVRIPYQRVPSVPPYVSRSAADKALVTAVNNASQILVICGGGPRLGASRTLKVFIQDIPASQFRDYVKRVPVVFDLYPHAHLPLAEHLVEIRNLIVRAFDQAFGITDIGTHLFAFDALYTVWKQRAGMSDAEATPLQPTARGRLGAAFGKIAVTLAGAGAFEFIAPLKTLAEMAEKQSWAADAGLEFIRDEGSGRAVQARIRNVQDFIHRVVAPRVSSRLRTALADDDLDPDRLALVMYDILLEALARAQAPKSAKGRLVIAADSIDAVEEDDEEDENNGYVRFCLAGLLLAARRHAISGILCGRDTADAWRLELEQQPYTQERLGLLDKQAIADRLELANVVRDDILSLTGGLEDKVVAGDFHQAWRRAKPRFRA